VAAEEGVAAWCMAPTEYRIMAKRGVLQPIPSLHSLVAAGEALDPETLRMCVHSRGPVRTPGPLRLFPGLSGGCSGG
jgi:acyl-coenzyme A synthetase/AMP-(fatty) acid ligase